MTDQSKLKRAVRARAKKTGESYTTARRRITDKLDRERSSASQETAAKARGSQATGSVTEARCIEKTGHGFDHWFAELDRFGAVKKGHTAAARHLRAAHGVSGWYCQAITVAYERARGVRQLNQLCSGGYQVSVSRVLTVPVEHAATLFARKAERLRWLPDAGPGSAEIATAIEGRRFTRTPSATRVSFDLPAGRVELRITAKDPARCTVVATVTKLADQDAVALARDTWRRVLDTLRASLQT